MNHSLGVDIGSISTKGVILDDSGRLIAEAYLLTEGNPLGAVRRLLGELQAQLPADSQIYAVGTTGSARRLIGAMLEADAVKNEITAHAVGTLSRHPNVRTILEIGGQDSKIIILNDGIVTDYAMNTLCAAGTGAFLSAQAGRLGLAVEDMGGLAQTAAAPARIAARCTVFAESDLIHKAQTGHSKADLVAGLCNAVASNYLSNVGKGKKITPPVIFQGGVSRNQGVTEAFRRELNCEVLVDPDGPLMGAVGTALLAAKAPKRAEPFRFEIAARTYETKAETCAGCGNYCEIVRFVRDGVGVDAWGHRCEGIMES
ncbi:MAG: acyl-CoA dehydratase activase [Oscillospiraceae bacterium]|nr:acyl-CoA dehydratase activase [Oscillospiraceae bacterium]